MRVFDDFDIEDKFLKVKKERCDGCKYCKEVHANGGFSFYGCHHKPYRGKWVAEIKDCPKASGERKNNGTA
jgi:Fe-S-cluster-containing hydrogenase component 2